LRFQRERRGSARKCSSSASDGYPSRPAHTSESAGGQYEGEPLMIRYRRHKPLSLLDTPSTRGGCPRQMKAAGGSGASTGRVGTSLWSSNRAAVLASASVCLALVYLQRQLAAELQNGLYQGEASATLTSYEAQGKGSILRAGLTATGAKRVVHDIVECPAANDADQMRRFWGIWRAKETEYVPIKPGFGDPVAVLSSEGYQHEVLSDAPPGNAQRRFKIVESYTPPAGQPDYGTIGGSSFRGEINGAAGQLLCRTVDNFDGTYSMCCPPVLRASPQEPCSNLTVYVMFTRYFGWQADGPLVPLQQVR
jgi:hypothetical protein